MSEEQKIPEMENTAPETEETAADTTAGQEAPETGLPATDAEAAEAAEKTEKRKKEAKKKEKGFTLTREQMEAAEKAAQQLVALKDQYTRLAAEYDNYRKRTVKEKESIYQDAKIDTVQKFLGVYDNLERAMATEGGDDSPHKKGLEMIFNQYKKILGELGVTEIEAKGQPFDPNRHNAVMHIDDENLGENVVAQVFQAGFMLGDKVLRFATVQVAN